MMCPAYKTGQGNEGLIKTQKDPFVTEQTPIQKRLHPGWDEALYDFTNMPLALGFAGVVFFVFFGHVLLNGREIVKAIE